MPALGPPEGEFWGTVPLGDMAVPVGPSGFVGLVATKDDDVPLPRGLEGPLEPVENDGLVEPVPGSVPEEPKGKGDLPPPLMSRDPLYPEETLYDEVDAVEKVVRLYVALSLIFTLIDDEVCTDVEDVIDNEEVFAEGMYDDSGVLEEDHGNEDQGTEVPEVDHGSEDQGTVDPEVDHGREDQGTVDPDVDHGSEDHGAGNRKENDDTTSDALNGHASKRENSQDSRKGVFT